MLGHTDSEGDTVITAGSLTFTYSGQEVIKDGVTFKAASTSENYRSGSNGALKSMATSTAVIAPNGTTSTSLDAVPDSPTAARKPTTVPATSSVGFFGRS